MDDFIFFAYKLDGDGKGQLLNGSEIAKTVQEPTLAWVHLDANHPETQIWLEREVSYLDPFILEALLAEETRPRLTQVGEGFLMILRGVNLNQDERPEDMVSIRLWVDEHRIISVRRRPVRAAQDLAQLLIEGQGSKDAGHFIAMLVARLSGRMEPVLSDLNDRMDAIEEELMDQPSPRLRSNITQVRKQAIQFRRYMAPQREAISQLRQAEGLRWLSERERRRLGESFQHLTRYIEDLDTVRERAQVVKDELSNLLADRTNRTLYILSVVTAIFLPLGFLTGLLGVNVGGMPGADAPTAFLYLCLGLTGLVLAQVLLFKLWKWF